MTFEQASLLILLVAMLALFLMDRFRVEVVAIAGLLAGYALGLYPVDQVFAGVASPVVITVVEILLVAQVLARTRLFDRLTIILADARFSNSGVIAILSAATGFISIFMNNIGAFSIALPVALRVSTIMGIPKRQLVMPISFAALLGGLVSLIGTPANLIVSDALSKATGRGLRLFDFAYVGLPVAIAGIALTAWLAPRLFPGRQEDPSTAVAPPRRRMVAERRVPANSPLVGTRLSALPDRFALRPHGLLRNDVFVFGAPDNSVVEMSDLLLAEADDAVFDELAASGALATARRASWQEETTRIEAVVMPESTLVGSRLRSLDVFASRDVAVTALSMRSPRMKDASTICSSRSAMSSCWRECARPSWTLLTSANAFPSPRRQPHFRRQAHGGPSRSSPAASPRRPSGSFGRTLHWPASSSHWRSSTI